MRKERIRKLGHEWSQIKDSEIKSKKGRVWGGKVVTGQSLPYYPGEMSYQIQTRFIPSSF